ncbi:Multidrug resistance protein MdtG [uncultured archaeon]|nr:Multidrug resistance protein MdtG [uncultured archaeon]
MHKTLKLLTISDIFIFSGFGLVSPILAIFFKDNLAGGTLFTAGVASAIFLITHAILQIIFAEIFSSKDRRWMLLLGTVLIVFVPFGYIFSTSIWHIFIIQFIYGVGAGFAYPSWYSLFTSNIEKKSSGFQWSVYNSGVSIGTGITAAVGAWLAEEIGFQWVFGITGIVSVLGLLILFKLDKNVAKKV